jgi:hypothetical protein
MFVLSLQRIPFVVLPAFYLAPSMADHRLL